MTGVRFFDEKIWITSYFLKRRKGFGKDAIFRSWCGWWQKDFLDEDGQSLALYKGNVCKKATKKQREINGLQIVEDKNNLFNEICERVFDNVKNLTLDEIKCARMDAAISGDLSKNLERQAHNKGLRIRRSAYKRHPMSLSGFQIVKANNLKKVVAGRTYDLTEADVRGILRGISNDKR